MFARGAFSFHPARFPAYPENLPSPIIPALARNSPKSNYSRTYGIPWGGGCTGFLVGPIRLVYNSFVSPTYAKTGGYTPCGKCRRADIFDFSPYFLRFLARLLRQRLLSASGAPEVLAGFRQRVDGIEIFVAAIQRFRIVGFNSRAVIFCPVGNAQLPVVFLQLVHPALADKRHIADDARRGKSRQIAHDVVLQLLRFMMRQAPVLGVGNHVALIVVVRHDFAVIEQRKTKLQQLF